MPKVIFDTNAYRDLVTDKTFEEIDDYITLIKAKEAENEIITMFSPIVAQELLVHVADKTDWAYHVCLRATKALYLHNGDRQTINIFPTFETLLGQMYFHEIPQQRVQTYEAIAQICMHLAMNPTDATFAIFDERLQFIKQMVGEAEAGFVAGMLDFVRLTDPTATDWMPFRNDAKKRKQLLLSLRSDEASHQIAKGYVFMAHVAVAKNGHDKIYTAEQINDITNDVLQKFPEPIALFKTVIEHLTNSDFPLDEASRANFLWDIALMFGAGKHLITDDKLYFITADKALIRTAIQQGSRTSVLKLDEYLDYLGI